MPKSLLKIIQTKKVNLKIQKMKLYHFDFSKHLDKSSEELFAELNDMSNEQKSRKKNLKKID
jgi:hypothetical protein